MKKIAFFLTLFICTIAGFAQTPVDDKIISIHLLNYEDDEDLEVLSSQLQALEDLGINQLFLEVDYHFEFTTHPELISPKFITKAGAQKFARDCKAHGMKVIPQFQSLGHQSWAENTWQLLTVYPEFDLTPGAFPNNEGIYCREWDPMNPKVNETVFPMIEEILEAFDADGLHIGMDEVFLITSEFALSTKDKDPAEVYAKVVNDFYDHFSKKLNKKLYMWGDRLIDGKNYNYGEWESSFNGTAPAIDMIPKDIVICDWHYEPMPSYGSVQFFIDKGFEVLPCSWKNPIAAEELIKGSFALNEKAMLGHMFTTWGAVANDSLLQFESMIKGIARVKSGKFYDPQIDLVEVKTRELVLEISNRNTSFEVYYTLDGTTPTNQSTKYGESVILTKSCQIKAVLYQGNVAVGDVVERDFVVHKGVGTNVQLKPKPSEKYPTILGGQTLVNGIKGSLSFKDGEWVGFDAQDVELVCDLIDKQKISKVSFTSHNANQSWIFHPTSVKVLGSTDGKKYKELKTVTIAPSTEELVDVMIDFRQTKIRYLKVVIDKRIIPAGFEGAGNGAWLFIDELVVE